MLETRAHRGTGWVDLARWGSVRAEIIPGALTPDETASFLTGCQPMGQVTKSVTWSSITIGGCAQLLIFIGTAVTPFSVGPGHPWNATENGISSSAR